MNKQTKHEVDKEAKKIAQEEISHEIGAIRTELNQIKDFLQQQPSNTFIPNDLITQIQQFFEESQQQLQEINQRLTDFVQKTVPLWNQSVQQAEKQNTAMSQPLNQFGNGQIQQTNTNMDQMTQPIPQQSYGQNQYFTQNQLSQSTQQASNTSPFNHVAGQGQMNFNQPYSGYGTQIPNYYGNGPINNQNQTMQNYEHREF